MKFLKTMVFTSKKPGQKNEKYVYKYVRYYRNAEGKPRNKAKSIGKYDEATGKVIPNSNYTVNGHKLP